MLTVKWRPTSPDLSIPPWRWPRRSSPGFPCFGVLSVHEVFSALTVHSTLPPPPDCVHPPSSSIAILLCGPPCGRAPMLLQNQLNVGPSHESVSGRSGQRIAERDDLISR